MQFHHHGYVSTDPRLLPAAGVGLEHPHGLPDAMDVLVVGAGPAGMATAASLSMFPDIDTHVVDRREGRLVIGQADGIQARSVETFQAFGFANRITEEAFRLESMNFWGPDPVDPTRIVRTARELDDADGRISEFPHLIVNQARVLDHFAEFMANSPSRAGIDWGYEFVSLDRDDSREHPIRVTLRITAGQRLGEEIVIRAKYVLGADGAHSKVRHAIGRTAVGGKSWHAWGVMDVLADTDFPDIRTKCAITSSAGSILHIPREGGHLFRMYVDLGEISKDDPGDVRATTVDECIARARAIIAPYTLTVKHVAWSSVYEVGHRVTDSFDDAHDEGQLPRVFIAGDACHTHSAKAGQGMNVSMQDGFNLGWKLGHVLTGRADEKLLSTYSSERQVIAQNLIDFDKEWSSMMARKPSDFASTDELAKFYTATAEFPAGFMTQYTPSCITATDTHQALATGFGVGKRFKSNWTIRLSDTVRTHIGHRHRADGRFRLYAFADAARAGEPSALQDWADWMLRDNTSPLNRYTPKGGDDDATFDIKAIHQQPYDTFDYSVVHPLFTPRTGPFGLIDYEKVYCADPRDDIFDTRGIDRDRGALVVVRPDQYVAAVLPLTDRDELPAYFAGFLRARD